MHRSGAIVHCPDTVGNDELELRPMHGRRGVSADVARAGAVERRVACSGPRQRRDFREIQGLITSFEGRARRGRRRRAR